MKIKIGNTQVTLKNSLRAHIVYESIQNKSFDGRTMTDIIIFMWSVYATSLPKDAEVVELDDFIEWLDSHKEKIDDFVTWLLKEQQRSKLFKNDKDATEEGSNDTSKKQ